MAASLELSAGYSYKDLFHPIFQVLQQRSNDYNVGVRYVAEQSLGGLANRFVLGAYAVVERGERRPLRQRGRPERRSDGRERSALTQPHRVCAG